MKKTTNRNYDNRELGPDEELVLYFINEADLDSYTNPFSVVRFFIGRVWVTGAWTAFKKGDEAKEAKKQFNFYIRDLNGQFHCKDALSIEAAEDDYGLEESTDANDPAELIELYDTGRRIVQRLMDEAPQLLAAIAFHREGLFGSAFQKAMKVGHSRSADLQKELSRILHDMVYFEIDQVELAYKKTKYDDYYKEIAEKHINEIYDDLIEMYLKA